MLWGELRGATLAWQRHENEVVNDNILVDHLLHCIIQHILYSTAVVGFSTAKYIYNYIKQLQAIKF